MSDFKPGDWRCSSCGYHNFRSRDTCKHCAYTKEGSPPLVITGPAVQQDDNVRAVDRALVSTPSTSLGSGLPPRRDYLCAIDIERAGPHFHHGIMAIGVCFGHANGKVLEQQVFCWAVPPEEEFDPDTWTWWQQFPDVLARIDRERISHPLDEFQQFMVDLERKYGPFGRKHNDTTRFELVSDNPAYDIGHINLQLHLAGFVYPLAEMFDDYVSTSDPTEQITLASPALRKKLQDAMKTPHTHWPVDDATRDYELQCAIEMHRRPGDF